MASSAAKVAKASPAGSAGLLIPVFAPLTVATIGFGGYYISQLPLRDILWDFFTGPGRTSRISLLVFLVVNHKSLLFGWTARVFGAMFRHLIFRRDPLPPQALFHYLVTRSRTSLLETDYNFHKSNATYFEDLDVSRAHLVMHLLGPGMKAVVNNAQTKLVRDKEGTLIKGGFGIGLGSVFCSFKKETAPFQKYEIWSRVLSWDRKWLYIVTHFVVAGKVKPTSWDAASFLSSGGKVRRVTAGPGSGKGGDGKKEANGNGSATSSTPAAAALPADFEKYVIATATSKYVFKLGRFTVHPTIVLEASGVLPERPGDGWRGGETETGTPEELSDDEVPSDADGGEWDWRRIEWERRKGMEFAAHFAAMDGLHATFDGGNGGALGRFSPG